MCLWNTDMNSAVDLKLYFACLMYNKLPEEVMSVNSFLSDLESIYIGFAPTLKYGFFLFWLFSVFHCSILLNVQATKWQTNTLV